jgi:UDP-glucose 6-dehydrogenase
LADRFGAAATLPTLDRLSGFDVVFLCVPTEPIDGTGAADLSIIEGLVENFAGLERHPWWRPPVLVQRSTCPPGTAATAYAVNPSFLAKSTQWLDSDCPSRIAYAGPSGARALLARLYSGFPGSPCFASDSYEAVELLKYIENSIDAVLISLWNEFLCLADALGVSRSDFLEVLRATPDRDRFATTVRVPGGAFGLGCDPAAEFVSGGEGEVEALEVAGSFWS